MYSVYQFTLEIESKALCGTFRLPLYEIVLVDELTSCSENH